MCCYMYFWFRQKRRPNGREDKGILELTQYDNLLVLCKGARLYPPRSEPLAVEVTSCFASMFEQFIVEEDMS